MYKKAFVAVLSMLSVFVLSTGVAFADSSMPTFQVGQQVDLYTFDWSSATSGFSVTLGSANIEASAAPTTVSATVIKQTQASDGGYIDELQITLPNLGNSSGVMNALISINAGALVTRFQPVQPPITGGYGVNFNYDATPLAGQLPEVPVAGALPAVMVAALGGMWFLRKRRLSGQQ